MFLCVGSRLCDFDDACVAGPLWGTCLVVSDSTLSKAIFNLVKRSDTDAKLTGWISV